MHRITLNKKYSWLMIIGVLGVRMRSKTILLLLIITATFRCMAVPKFVMPAKTLHSWTECCQKLSPNDNTRLDIKFLIRFNKYKRIQIFNIWIWTWSALQICTIKMSRLLDCNFNSSKLLNKDTLGIFSWLSFVFFWGGLLTILAWILPQFSWTLLQYSWILGQFSWKNDWFWCLY